MNSIHEVRDRLIQSRLMNAEAVDQLVRQWHEQQRPDDEAAGEPFADWLVERGRLTEFQGEAIVAGHAGPFTLGAYEVHEHLAAGRWGGLFRAVHREFDQQVTLKVFPSSLSREPERVARVSRELRVAVEMDHSNVIRSFQLGRIGETYYLAMEDLQGEPLEVCLDRDGFLPYRQACRIIRDAALGLGHLHEKEVVHRDVRPANIWITTSGVAKLMEFGAARDAYAFLDALDDGGLTTSDTVLGEYDYVAPEQARDPRDADVRSDIYSLGCTLYHCLTSRPPFVEKNPVKQMLKHATEAAAPPSTLVEGLPEQLDATLAGMLAKLPDERFQTAENVAFALEPFIDKEPQELVVQDVSPQYLQWVRGEQPTEPDLPPEDAVGVTPELTQFLDWMSRKQARKKKKKK